MRRLRVPLAFLALVFCAHARSQSFGPLTNNVPVISVDGLWRFQFGDNPAWAERNFDDSKWSLLHSNAPWTDQGYKGRVGIAWYRFHADVPASIKHVSLYLPRIFTCYEVFANGSLVGTFGKMPPNQDLYGGGGDFRLYRLPDGINRDGSIEIALRIWQSPRLAFEDAGPLHSGSLIGDSTEIAHRDRLYWGEYHWYLISEQTLAFLEFLAGIGSLLLFALRRREPEYLWFGLTLLFLAAGFAVDLYSNFEVVNTTIMDAVSSFIAAAATLASIAFYQALLKPRRSWMLALATICILASILVAPLASAFPRLLAEPVATMVATLLAIPVSVWVLVVFVQAARARSQDARLLIFPVFLEIGTTLCGQIMWITYTLGWQGRFNSSSVVLARRPVRIQLDQITGLLFLLAVMAILILRFTRTRGQEERYASEMEGARSVQQFLIPDDLPSIPGLRIECDYRPAREVGGDFFQVIPFSEDDSALIVVGDVAGKGLQAGMLATLLVGAVRTAATFTRDPARILSTLNERLCEKGNATCLVLCLESRGAATLVNAGHLPPYLNGVELAMEGALPLGTIPDVIFPILNFRISPGDTLTLISDGILEAQKPDGELFGFERIARHLVHSKSASSLAAAAQEFGQEDDITVLTIERVAVLVGT